MATRLPEKQNFLQKFVGIFVPDDPQEMKSYIWMNIIVPGIKNALYSTVGAALGINRPNYPGYGMYNSYNYGYSYPHSYGTYQNYSSYTQAAHNPPATNGGYKTGIFAFSTKVEATSEICTIPVLPSPISTKTPNLVIPVTLPSTMAPTSSCCIRLKIPF